MEEIESRIHGYKVQTRQRRFVSVNAGLVDAMKETIPPPQWWVIKQMEIGADRFPSLGLFLYTDSQHSQMTTLSQQVCRFFDK